MISWNSADDKEYQHQKFQVSCLYISFNMTRVYQPETNWSSLKHDNPKSLGKITEVLVLLPTHYSQMWCPRKSRLWQEFVGKGLGYPKATGHRIMKCYVMANPYDQSAYLCMSRPHMNLFFGEVALLRWHSGPQINTNILRYVKIGSTLVVIHFFNWNNETEESSERIPATVIKSTSLNDNSFLMGILFLIKV